MEQYLIDTNIVSGYFSSSFSKTGLDWMDKVIDDVPNISIITQIELLCWQTDIVTEVNIKEFIDDSKIWNITDEVLNQCVSIRRKKKIKTPDAIIAATALVNGFIIITNNEKDFRNIKGLKLINPFQL
jgi:predicted nucleic acid-binding protein